MNVNLLRKVQKAILHEPKQFIMGSWYSQIHDLGKVTEIPNCGTAACIAGWAVALSLNKNPKQAYDDVAVFSIECTAERELGLDPDQVLTLFHAHRWPMPFRDQFSNTGDPTERAKIACARIDHLIETGE